MDRRRDAERWARVQRVVRRPESPTRRATGRITSPSPARLIPDVVATPLQRKAGARSGS